MISQPSLEKFKKLYHQRFNERLDDAEALGRANRLLNIYMAVYGDPFDYKSRQEDIETELLVNQINNHEETAKDK